MKKHSTKRALLLSALAMLLCMSLLVGSTFAWFTDSVVSANNKIKAGTLEVQLLMYDGTEYADISETSAPIFGVGSIAQNNNAETLWEPGKTQVAYLAIKNNGTLALKYQVGLNVVNVANDLYEVMEYVITPDAQQGAVTAWDGTNAQSCVEGTQVVTTDVSLAVGATHYFALSIHMMEEAGNEYQAGEVNFDLVVLATQDTVEEDSFDNQYDADATYPSVGFGYAPVVPGEDWLTMDIKNGVGHKIGSALIPTASVADDAEGVNIRVDDTVPLYEGVTVAADQKAKTYEITATGLKSGVLPTPVKIELEVGTGLSGVKLYHYTDEMNVSYNPATGNIIFEVTSLSPFTVVYDAEYQAQPDNGPLPQATLTAKPEYANTAIDWKNYSGLYPSRGTEQTLDVVYSFASQDTSETVMDSPYKDWKVDFYVMLKDEGNAPQAIPEGALTLGGHYGDFGWVGFDNPYDEENVKTNTYIPLLQSVGGAWTYEAIVDFVGEFMCGVASNSDFADGMSFVVELRVINPENADEWYAVNTVEYFFN